MFRARLYALCAHIYYMLGMYHARRYHRNHRKFCYWYKKFEKMDAD